MKNFEDEPWDINNPPTTEEDTSVDPTEIQETAEKKLDAEVFGLYEDARGKLKKIDEKTERQKKQIVVDLAKDLEGKIQMDSICADIVTQLRGQVSERTVRDCLDEKYKKQQRVKNARKQKRRQQAEPESIDNLAAPMPLNQDDEKKEVVTIDTNGMTMLQEEEDSELDGEGDGEEHSTTSTDSSITKHGSLTELQPPQPQEQQEETEEPACAYSNGNDLSVGEVVPGEDLEEPNRFNVTNKTLTDLPFTNNNDSDASDDDRDVFHSTFSVPYRELQKYLASFFQKMHGGGEVLFNVKVNKRTGHVISFSFGE